MSRDSAHIRLRRFFSPPPKTEVHALSPAIRRHIVLTTLAAVALVGFVVNSEIRHGNGDVDWALFGIIAAMLWFAEIATRRSMRVGKHGARTTPTWGLSFALILLGSPTGAIVATASVTLLLQVWDRRGLWRVVFNVSQVSLSLALGGLCMFAFGIHGPLIDADGLPATRWIAMAVAAAAILLSNVLLVSYPISAIEQAPFRVTVHASLAISLSADSAIFLAPVLVASAQMSVLLVPWLIVATLLMYRTAKQAFVSGHEADHDALTQLLNRRAFVAQVDAAVGDSGAETGAVVVLDLDRFKDINDRLGHETGDHVLQAFAKRLTDSLAATTCAARFGGDEFAILMRPLERDRALADVEALHAALSTPMMVDGFPLTTGVSMGVALFPEHGSSTDSLLHAADIAMYRAKRLRSNVELFEQAGSVRERGRMSLLADLNSAVANNELRVHYQPQVDLATGRIMSIEALVRWEHPSLGLIAPDDFIGLAEQTDLIDTITNFVIRHSVAEVATIDSDVALAVNVSARNVRDRRFARDVLELLDAASFDPTRFEIELTERSIAQDPERTTAACAILRQAGVRVAVDDFGTGYSSFATLRDLAVDCIKIDRSLIMHLSNSDRDRRIVRTIIDLAHALGSQVVAEGVESREVWAHLETLGCDLVQGYVVSEPVPLDEIDAMIHRRTLLQFPV